MPEILGLVVVLSAPVGCVFGDGSCVGYVVLALCNALHAGVVPAYGLRIGKGSEIATNLAGRYDIVSVGENCFIADEVAIADEDIRRGWMHLKSGYDGRSRIYWKRRRCSARNDIALGCIDRRKIETAGRSKCRKRRHMVWVASDPSAGAAESGGG